MRFNLLTVVSVAALGLAVSCSPKAKQDPIEARIDSLIGQMTTAEKVAMIHGSSSFTSGGVPRLGIPEWTMSDGPHGVRLEHGRGWGHVLDVADSVSYLPTGITLAATWNPELGVEYGKVLGSEARHRGKDVILGPGVNIMRTPLNGRNFEYMSEDPYLSGSMAVGYIKGVQSQDVATCVKHYALNNQEIDRASVNVQADERTLREIYLPAFQMAVQDGGAYTVMSAYNKFRGVYCSHSDYLLNKILKKEFGFEGAVISDWAAAHNSVDAFNGGLDVEMGTDLTAMPNPDYSKFFMGDTIVSLIKSGKLDEKVLDDKVRRILRIMFKTNMIGGKQRKTGEVNTAEHQAVCQKVAEEGIVLLKNDGILPLANDVNSIAVIGANATRVHSGAGGSSQVEAKYEITPLDGIKRIAGSNVKVKYAEGYKIIKDGKADKKLIAEAVAAAKSSKVAIIVGGYIHGYSNDWGGNALDSEGCDKVDLTLPFGQDELIQAVTAANPNTIVVVFSGSAINVNAWINQIKGFVHLGYPGMNGGVALARILFGQVNPSGKLTFTYPVNLADCAAHAKGDYPGVNRQETYKEGLFVGYRYFDANNIAPLYPFGYGLSYTTFAFENMKVSGNKEKATVTLTVRNTGKVAGAEVVQLYVKQNKTKLTRPDKELKAFAKVFLQPGESKVITLNLTENAFHYYDDKQGKWVVDSGEFTLMAGNSSRNIMSSATLKL
jgi:beta-glucosidase